MNASEPSDELYALVGFVVTHAVDSVRGGGPLVPFAVTEDAEGRKMNRFLMETLEDGQEAARQHVRETAAARVAVAYDGYLTLDGSRSDAVFVEVCERGAETGLVFAQRYRPASSKLRRFRKIDDVEFVEQREPF